jgi:hypothetical protein
MPLESIMNIAVLLYHIFCFVLSSMDFIMPVVFACVCILSDKDIDLFHIQLSSDRYWISETYMYVHM